MWREQGRRRMVEGADEHAAMVDRIQVLEAAHAAAVEEAKEEAVARAEAEDALNKLSGAECECWVWVGFCCWARVSFFFSSDTRARA